MKHNLIKIENYLLVVDEDITKATHGCLIYRSDIGIIYCDNNFFFDFGKPYKKVISHLPLNGAPYLDGVDVLPLLEDDVDQLARLKYPIIMSHNGRTIAGGHYDIDVNYSERLAYKHGYNKAREKFLYTEEDIDKAYWAGMKFVGEDKGSYKEFIQSLQQPKLPIAFECELFDTQFRDINTHELIKGRKKTITNSEGRKEWVGKWIYE